METRGHVVTTFGVLCLLAFLTASSSRAATYTWTPGGGNATYNWNNSGLGENNWNSAFPNAVDDVANIQSETTWWQSQTINLDQAVTVGTLNLSGWYMVRTINANGGSLTFGVSSGSATLNDTTASDMYNSPDRLNAPVILNSPLIINAAATNNTGFSMDNGIEVHGGLQITGVVSGAGGITTTGPNMLLLSKHIQLVHRACERPGGLSLCPRRRRNPDRPCAGRHLKDNHAGRCRHDRPSGGDKIIFRCFQIIQVRVVRIRLTSFLRKPFNQLFPSWIADSGAASCSNQRYRPGCYRLDHSSIRIALQDVLD